MEKNTLKDLKSEAKKHGVPVACRTKMDIEKDLPRDGLEKLTGSEK